LFDGVDVPWERSTEGHAGPSETSLILKVRPDLVHMDTVLDDEGKALGRLKALREAGVQDEFFAGAAAPF